MENKRTHKTVLLSVLNELVRVCEANNLRYYLAYGTLLGAIRHNGLIPWDDDIDVLMPRKDYEKLQALQGSWQKDFQLSSYKNASNFRYDILKLESTSTTLIERVSPLYIGGVFVDIFPLDNVMNQEEYKTYTKEVENLMPFYIRACLTETGECRNWLEYERLKIDQTEFNYKKILSQWDNITSAHACNSTEFVQDFHCPYFKRGLMKSEWFEEGVDVEFEGKKYKAPKNYVNVLKLLYGDYMTPPPVECRTSGHTFAFEDLSHRLTRDELKPILAKIQKDHTFKFSIKKEIKNILSI